MGRKSIKDTRQREIIEVFYEVAKREGLENTSIAKLASELAINPSLIMHYFQTRDDLIEGLIDYMLDKYRLIYEIPALSRSNAEKTLLEVIDRLFSKEWNNLFDDSLFYSCYSLTFRNQNIKEIYKTLLDSLRSKLAELIQECHEAGFLYTKNAYQTADLIYVIIDGAYYYLSLIGDPNEYQQNLNQYKQQAIDILYMSTSDSPSSVSVNRPQTNQKPGHIDGDALMIEHIPGVSD